jgi:AAA domain-containing protein/CHC2-type zinc finger protein
MTVSEAKKILPLPTLLHREGLGDCAKKSARCPFHDDKRNSFSIYKNGSGEFRFKCFAGCGAGDEITFLEKRRDISRSDATKLFIEMAGGSNGSAPMARAKKPALFDWQRCVDAFNEKHLEWLSDWRGFPGELCSWLKQARLVGIVEGCIACPVIEEGAVVAAHVRAKDGSWRYSPKGAKVRPLVIGELLPGDTVHVFESQWDAFAFMAVSGERSGIIITRGASNGVLVADVIPKQATVYVWPQNDAAGQKLAKDVCAHTQCAVKSAKIPSQFADLNDWTRGGGTAKDLLDAIRNAETLREPERPLIEFRSPLQLKNFTPPPGLVLAGDFHIVKGSVFVIGGAPGVGKSRAAIALAVAGATGSDWFGLKVHRRFKVLIVQTENGEFRLAREFAELDCDALGDFVRICPPPPYGLCFGRDGFREQLAAAIADFKPDLVGFDPWNAAAREQDSREYLDTFDALKSVLPLGDDAPALGIVAHTRKPKTDERASGRALLNLLAGSYVLGSVPRTVFVMQAASDDTTDNRIVWTCCKNNDGSLGARSVWERRNGLFVPVADFDFDAFDAPEKDKRELVSGTDVQAVLKNGALTKAEAAKRLEENTGAHRASCYRALKLDGRFANHLRVTGEKIEWK